MIIPDVQYPHCIAPASRNASCTGCSWSPLRQPFDGGDLLLRDRANPGDARALRFSVDQDRAGAALAFAAAVLASGQIEMLAQHGQQAGLRIGVNRCKSFR